MKRNASIISGILLFSLIFSACTTTQTNQVSDEDIEATVQQKLSDSLTETAVFQKAVSEELTQQAPPPTKTFTPTPAATFTPLPTDTPAITDTPTLEPTSENPWVLQAWCLEHEGCAVYEVRNKTDDWMQVTLTKTDTGEIGFFSIRRRSTGYITLRSGQYDALYTWWCNGDMGSMKRTWPAGLWIDIFECPNGYKYSIKK